MNNFNQTKTPSEVFNLPVIGKIKCELNITFVSSLSKNEPSQQFVGEDTFEVIKVVDLGNDEKLYLCNQWNEPNVIQQVHSMNVVEFIKF